MVVRPTTSAVPTMTRAGRSQAGCAMAVPAPVDGGQEPQDPGDRRDHADRQHGERSVHEWAGPRSRRRGTRPTRREGGQRAPAAPREVPEA